MPPMVSRAARWMTLGVLAGCCHASSAPPPREALTVPPEGPPASGEGLVVGPPLQPGDLADRPLLLEQLRESPFAYLRFAGASAADAVCRRFSDDLSAMPVVNLHGDAHLEQYSITRDGRGLADFDDATTGPAVIDLARFSASVQVACRMRGWDAEVGKVLEAFFGGYREALAKPELVPVEPGLVTRLRASSSRTPAEFFSWCESMMLPLPDEQQRRFDAGMGRFRRMMGEVRPDLPPSFFEIKRSGALEFGIGSALDDKALARIEGPTEAPEDDIILEVKEVRDMRKVSCVHAGVGAGAFRVLLGQSRIGRLPQAVLGYVPRGPDEPRGSRPYWVQSWSHDYRELMVKDLGSPEELAEIAHDVGVQLGVGHTYHIADPLDVQFRYAQRAMIDAFQDEITAFSLAQANATYDQWTRFRDAATSKKEPRP